MKRRKNRWVKRFQIKIFPIHIGLLSEVHSLTFVSVDTSYLFVLVMRTAVGSLLSHIKKDFRWRMRQSGNSSSKFPKSVSEKRKRGKIVKETIESITSRYVDFTKVSSSFKLIYWCLYSSLNSVCICRQGELQEDSRTITSFSRMPLSRATQQGLKENNFLNPTDIQRESLQYSLTGADVVGAAKTGSGKTLAFLIPVCFNHWVLITLYLLVIFHLKVCPDDLLYF